nr:HIRAN domain-containing protein [uncultured Shinella sp.]
MAKFILNWQDPESRRWHSVGTLTHERGLYFFVYTRGAKLSSRFVPFGNMSKLDRAYVSETLFPIFANRILNEKRPEFEKYSEWSGLSDKSSRDPLLLMARMGGGRATDTMQVYPIPEKSMDGKYKTVFFSHGISHISQSAQRRCLGLANGDVLYAMLDVQNPFDEYAVALRTADPAEFVGYCPRYLAKDVRKLLGNSESELAVRVKQVNFDAPFQYKLLCEIEADWPIGFEPCDDEDKIPLVQVNVDSIFDRLRHASL